MKEKGLETQFILETHVHADHLTASQYLKAKLGGPKVCIGEHITVVQSHFATFFGLTGFPADGYFFFFFFFFGFASLISDSFSYLIRSQFDRLFKEGDSFQIGTIECKVLHTPGHTPACLTYIIGGALFCGDTAFMPDMGSARCDFPGGSAETLWHSVFL